MPSYWTPKQERQYGHIKQSCVKRKCRRVKGKASCVRECTRIAAATTNKFRSQGLASTKRHYGGHTPYHSDWFERRAIIAALHVAPTRTSDLRVPNKRSALRDLQERGWVERVGRNAWQLTDSYFAEHATERATKMGGLGADPEWQLRETVPSPPNVTSPCRHLFCDQPALPGRTRCARHIQELQDYKHSTQPSRIGAVRGKCCVVRGKKRIACFHSRKDALALKRSLKKTSGLRIRCV